MKSTGFVRWQSNPASSVGGSPGESVWVVGAAPDVEPKAVVENGRSKLNTDRGNQGGGKAVWESKTLKSTEALTVKAGAGGKLWLLVGFDSGFEAASKLNFQSVVLDAEPLK